MRRHDWPEQMFEEIADSEDIPFAWGVNDCCLFVARVVDRMTDSTLVEQLRAMYSNEDAAIAMILSHGGLANAVSSFLGAPVDARATRGDVVMFAGGTGDAVGICLGADIIGVGPQGLHRVPRSEIKTVWKV